MEDISKTAQLYKEKAKRKTATNIIVFYFLLLLELLYLSRVIEGAVESTIKKNN